MKKLIPMLLGALFVSACGSLGHIDHEGTISTVISVDSAQLTVYFQAYCEKKLEAELAQAGTPGAPDPAAMTLCVNEEIGGFLAALSALGSK